VTATTRTVLMASARSVGPRLGREAVRERFPPRPIETDWPTTRCHHEQVLRLATAPAFVIENPVVQAKRLRGLRHLLDWLAGQPGDEWQ
jgi:hypothetical protein